MSITHAITCAHLPRDIYQRRSRYWPESRQKPYLEQKHDRHSSAI